ncbi:MAG: hypothetical protein AAF517_12510, partial [Planctomycetota bacterium]
MRNFLTLASLAVLLGIAGLLGSCEPAPKPVDPDAPLPPETDLYVYSLAVAQRARARVGQENGLAAYHEGKVHERFGAEDKALKLYEESAKLDPANPAPVVHPHDGPDRRSGVTQRLDCRHHRRGPRGRAVRRRRRPA